MLGGGAGAMVVACEVCGECMSLSLVSPACLYLCLCLQDRMPVTGQPEKLLDLLGSDLLGLPVERPAHGETTSLGAALAAGVGAGVFSAEEAFTVGTAGNSPAVFLPRAEREDVAKAYAKWNDAVERSYGLA